MSTENVRVAAIQMVSGSSIEDNLEAARDLVEEAADNGSDMVVLPENFATFGQSKLRGIGEAEADKTGPLRSFLSELAKNNKQWVVGGTIPTVEAPWCAQPRAELAPERVYAASYIINAQGEEVGRYDKIHLFDVDVSDKQGQYRESDSFQHGEPDPCIVATPWGKLGVAVCYDIRFPEYFRLLMEAGAEFVAIPSAFTYVTGKAHWQLLLRARAVENLYFTIGACQGGQHSSRRQTWGGSAIVSPWGDILAERLQGEGVVMAEMDLKEIERVRTGMPIAQHRKFSVVAKSPD